MLQPPSKRPDIMGWNLTSTPDLLRLMKLNGPVYVHPILLFLFITHRCLRMLRHKDPDAPVQFLWLQADGVHGLKKFLPSNFDTLVAVCLGLWKQCGKHPICPLRNLDACLRYVGRLQWFNWRRWGPFFCDWCCGNTACLHFDFRFRRDTGLRSGACLQWCRQLDSLVERSAHVSKSQSHRLCAVHEVVCTSSVTV